MRALAQRTTLAAKEIKTLIEHAQACVGTGVSEVEIAADSMGETTRSVGQVRELVSGIQRACEEQLDAISQVNEAVSSLDGITQQNAAMVEELSAAATALSERAKVMKGSVQVFRTEARAMAIPDAVSLRKQARARTAVQAARVA